jgi:hypothetical protein
MTIVAELASLPSARREGPANRADTEAAVIINNADIEQLFGPSVNRANIIIRNNSSTLTALIFSDIAGADIADATPILPLESITLENVKNAMYASIEGGVGSIKLTKLVSAT